MSYDIVFDFTSSGSGGALKRIQAFIQYFKKKKFKIIFLINKRAHKYLKDLEHVEYLVIEKSLISKLLCNQSHLNFIKEKPKWYYSYGFPIRKKVGQRNWFHISNALPLNINIKYLSFLAFFKMLIIRLQYKIFSNIPDIISAESLYTLNAYKNKINQNSETVLSRNGISHHIIFKKKQSGSFRYAIVVGTERYKRLYLAYKVFLTIKEKYKLHVIYIVGSLGWLNVFLRANKKIIIVNNLTDKEYISLVSGATFFISSSYVENSSNAALDGIVNSKYTILSDIPSHSEMLAPYKTKKLLINSYQYIFFEKSKSFKSPKWVCTIRKMIYKMNLI